MRRTPPVWAFLAFVLLRSTTTPAQEKSNEMKTYDEVGSLVSLLFSDDESNKIKSAVRLGKLHASYAVPSLTQALSDPSKDVRRAVVTALGETATAASAKALAGAAVKDDDPQVRAAAIAALTKLHIDAAYQGCVTVLQSSKDETVKTAALTCIKTWNEPHQALPPPLSLPKGQKEPKPKKPKAVKEKKPEKEPTPKVKPVPVPVEPKESVVIEQVSEIKEPSAYGKTGAGLKGEIITEFPESAEGEGEAAVTPPMLSKKDELEVPSEEAYVALKTMSPGIAHCMEAYDVASDTLKIKVLVTPGGKLGHLYVLGDVSAGAEQCVKTIIEGLEFPPFKASYVVDHEYHRTVAEEPAATVDLMKEEDIFPAAPPRTAAFIPLELNDLGTDSVERVIFAVPHSTGGVAFTLSGEYVIRHVVGLGLELNAGSGTYTSDGYDGEALKEKAVFGNLALFVRAAGSKRFEKFTLSGGANLFFYTPTATRGAYRDDYDFYGADGKLKAGTYASQIGYYRLERFYPNINKASRLFIRPDVGFALGNDMLRMQIETGFNILVLGTGTYGGEAIDASNVILIHFGAGFYYVPVSILQLSLEFTWIKDLDGRLYEDASGSNNELRSPGGEFFATPAATLSLPLGKGSATMTLGFRIPAGEISAIMSNFIWVMGAGYGW
jgi:hypothetical protein